MKTTTRTLATATVGAAALLLAACSGGDGGPTSADEAGTDAHGRAASTVFDFPLDGIEPATDVTVVVPDDLREALGVQAGAVLVDSIHVTAHDLDGLDHCAADLAITYADGGLEAIAGPVDAEAAAEEARDFAEHELLSAFDVSSLDEAAARVDDLIEQEGTGLRSQLVHIGLVGSDMGDLYEEGDTGAELVAKGISSAEESAAEHARKVTATPVADRIAPALDLAETGAPASELDDAAPEDGVYVTDDGSTVTVVGDCAADPFDPDEAVELEIPATDDDGDLTSFAEVQLTTMTDGTVWVGGSVDDYIRDANGDWISD
ncbi:MULTISPECIES: hypothetical protein [unclassified Isoptericola]|uniref:hypothetical protein n=1 Tax=unclassified Isoptericola TaxID=2623355 RepID=UPI00364A4941